MFTDKLGFGWLSQDDFVHHFAADIDPVHATVSGRCVLTGRARPLRPAR
jgi:hypothetical protein